MRTDEHPVEVFCQNGRANQQLAGKGTHHGSQNSGEQNTADPRIKQCRRKNHENTFMVFCNGFAEIRMSREESRSEEACGNGTGQREDEPNHADLAGARHHRSILGSHEANQNMRLTEITKAPSQE